MLIVTNPFNGETLGNYPALDASAMDEQIRAARTAQPAWRALGFDERARVLKAIAAKLRDNKTALAELMALEMGKPIKEGLAEVEKGAWCAEHYAENAAGYLARETLASDASESYVCYPPLGTVLGILPWNAPVWLAFRFLAPALMAGNTCVMKHDPHVPGTAAGIARACAEAIAETGAPEDIVVNLPVNNFLAADAIRHPAIAAVSFTGSSKAGAAVAAIAASEIKPSVLELGGSDPLVVLADADLEAAANVAVLSRIINAGQSCIAAKRVIVEQPVYDDFVAMVKTRLEKLRMGDPLQETTDIGPIARKDLQQTLHKQVQASISAGAKCLLGGDLSSDPGFFYPPTLLVDVTADMCAYQEETFGPIMVMMPAKDADDALQIANNTDYGLGAAVWTADKAKAAQFIEGMEAGQVAVNGIVKTDPRLPSGGIKRSGFGRELGPHGIKEFVNAKQVWIK